MMRPCLGNWQSLSWSLYSILSNKYYCLLFSWWYDLGLHTVWLLSFSELFCQLDKDKFWAFVSNSNVPICEDRGLCPKHGRLWVEDDAGGVIPGRCSVRISFQLIQHIWT